jgi:hypothetical protein
MGSAGFSDAGEVLGLDYNKLVARMVAALHEAESIRMRIDPSYQLHPLEELEVLVRATLAAGRDPGLLVIDILGDCHQAPES